MTGNSKFRRLAFAVSALLVATFACAAPPDEGPVLSPNVATLRIAAEQLANVPTTEMRQTLRIGDPEAADAYAFARVGGIEVAANGDVYVLDQGNHEVAVFSGDGKLLRKIGRRGNGPGEFGEGGFTAMELARDTIFIIEGTRLKAFSLDGRSLYDSEIDVRAGGEPIGRVDAVVHTAAGIAVVLSHSAHGREDGTYIDTAVVRFRSPQSGLLENPGILLPREPSHRRGQSYFLTIFGATPGFAIGSDATVYYSRGDHYLVEGLSSTGVLQLQIVGDAKRNKIVADERRRFDEKVLNGMAGAKDEHMRKAARDFSSIPRASHRPVIGRMITSGSNLLIVERADLRPLFDEEVVASFWDVIDVKRGLQARLQLPAGFGPPVLARPMRGFLPWSYVDGKVYGLEVSSTGADVVVRFER